MKQPGIATTVFADVELVSLQSTSSPSLKPGGMSGGHVPELARLCREQILGVLWMQLPVCNLSFNFLTLFFGSSS